MKIGIVADVDQFVGARGGGVAVFAGGDADLSRGGEMLWVEIGEGFGISVDRRNRVRAYRVHFTSGLEVSCWPQLAIHPTMFLK